MIMVYRQKIPTLRRLAYCSAVRDETTRRKLAGPPPGIAVMP